ncbi:hypothetical protein C8Q78DRAFT_931558, partial [Trametes maxima]
VTVEEIEDIEAGGLPKRPWIEDFPGSAGNTFGKEDTHFERIRRQKEEEDLSPWALFASEDEWELSEWLATTGLTQKDIDKYLSLKI